MDDLPKIKDLLQPQSRREEILRALIQDVPKSNNLPSREELMRMIVGNGPTQNASVLE